MNSITLSQETAGVFVVTCNYLSHCRLKQNNIPKESAKPAALLINRDLRSIGLHHHRI
jgi:hypothetical protein